MFGKNRVEKLLQDRIDSMALGAPQGGSVVAPETPAAPTMPPNDRYAPRNGPPSADFEKARALLQPFIEDSIDAEEAAYQPRGTLARAIQNIVAPALAENDIPLTPVEERDLVTLFINERIATGKLAQLETPAEAAISRRSKVDDAVLRIYPAVMERIDSEAPKRLSREALARHLTGVAAAILIQHDIKLDQREQRDLVTVFLNDLVGFGPLEPLLADDAVNDIMVNSAQDIYVERAGKLELTDIAFRDDAHVISICNRIAALIGRHIDEATPLVDARLPDGSRVNMIIPPLAVDGPSLSIRKFSKKTIDLDVMVRRNSMSPEMAATLKIAARCRLSILISGGTGSGKTTLLNALSKMIDPGERIVTIEDVAELHLLQRHKVRLETRPPGIDGHGEITARDLLKNALRMRPDRIIVGEIRGDEAIDMLQAMNTGHDGSFGTIHANTAREALTRLENMVGMAGVTLPPRAVRTQITSAINMVLHISRMRDGIRRLTSITEVVGMEGDIITTQELFSYRIEGEGPDGMLIGAFEPSGLRPYFMTRAEQYGLDQQLMDATRPSGGQ